MGIIRKTNPKGLDKIIDRIQVKLNTKLNLGVWENNHRAYKNPKPNKERGFIAELYTENGNYRECYYDDNFDAVSFFIASENSEVIENKIISQQFSLIFHVDLDAIYPMITHRADEELRMQVVHVLNSLGKSFVSIESIESGIQNVYKEFEVQNIKYDDMSNIHCVRFNLKTNYVVDCCINC